MVRADDRTVPRLNELPGEPGIQTVLGLRVETRWPGSSLTWLLEKGIQRIPPCSLERR